MCTAIASSFPVNVVSTRIWSNRQQGQRWAFGVRHVSMFVLLLLLAPRINMAADWSLKFGPAWHLDNRLRVDYNPQAVARDLRPSSYMRTTPGADAAIGSTGEYADHDYLDGFVHTDPGTVDPETDIPGLTWNWGYHSPGQNDGQSISFHANGGATYSEQELPLYADPVRFEDNFSLPGLELGVECALWQRETASAGLVLSMAWYTSRNFAYSARSPVALRIVTSSSSQIVDQYRTEGYTAPSAPYQGTYEGPGPLLNNIPDSRAQIGSSSSYTATWFAGAQTEIEVDQSEIALGPWLAWHPAERIRLSLSSQLLLARVCLKAETQTKFTPGSPPSLLWDFSRQSETVDWIIGTALEAGVQIYVYKGWNVGFTLAGIWWSDDISVSAEPFDVRLELGTWCASVVIGKEF